MTQVDVSLTLDERKAFIVHCSNLYETNGSSPISDKEWDAEYYAIQKLDPDWDIIGGMDEDNAYGTKVKHKVICGSLLKDPNPEAFEKSIASIYAGIDMSKLRFALQYKIDGSAMCCVYKKGRLESIITRGRDGIYGQDVTPNGRHISGIPTTIPCKDEEVEIRGECYKDRKDFYKNWAGQYSNPRNFTSGSVNQKDPNTTKERKLSFIAYEEVRKEFETEEEKLKFIIDNGFNNLGDSTKFTKEGLTFKQLAKAVQIFMNNIDRPNLPFDIDGIVVKLDNIALCKSLGSVSSGRKPKGNRAVKFECEQKPTKLIGVEYSTGRTGAITIVGLLEPCVLGGATIQRVSLHNFDFIKSKGLKIGSEIILQRAGDIIPCVVRVTKAGAQDIEPPLVCPACGGEVEWDSNNVTVHCQNEHCIAKINRSIRHWFEKIGVLGIGEGILNKLTNEDELSWDNEPIINKISDIYWKLDNDRKTEHPFRKYNYLKEKLGEKTYNNILESVKSVTEMTLGKFIEALGISQVGSLSKNIAEIAPTIEDIDRLTASDLMKIDKFADKKSHGFVNGWKSNRQEIDCLLKFITIVEPKLDSHVFSGQSYCFTGSFSSPSRKEMEQMTLDNGGKKSGVGKGLTALVWDGEMQGKKLEAAKKLGVSIITQEEFLEKLK